MTEECIWEEFICKNILTLVFQIFSLREEVTLAQKRNKEKDTLCSRQVDKLKTEVNVMGYVGVPGGVNTHY